MSNSLSLCIIWCAQWALASADPQVRFSTFRLCVLVASRNHNGIPDGLCSDSLVCVPSSLTISHFESNLPIRCWLSTFGNIFLCLFSANLQPLHCNCTTVCFQMGANLKVYILLKLSDPKWGPRGA